MRTNSLPPINRPTPQIKTENIKKQNDPHEQSKKLTDPVTLEKSSKQPIQSSTYTIDAQKLAQLKNDFSKNTESFKAMIRKMLERQGKAVNDVLKALDRGEDVSVLVDDETRALANDAISEDGYWGVEQTATRILDFAKAISGGDPSKIDMLISAFKEGFEAAKEAFGGTLPEISQRTYDRVLEGFEQWRNEG